MAHHHALLPAGILREDSISQTPGRQDEHMVTLGYFLPALAQKPLIYSETSGGGTSPR
jgi:hypothetical protein